MLDVASALQQILAPLQSALLGSTSPDLTGLEDTLAKQLGLGSADARALLCQVVWRLNARLFPSITHLELVHTEGCNLACTYCFEKDMLGTKRMPIEVARLAVDLLFQYSGDEKSLSITHFGGEPTLNFEGIRESTEYAETKAANGGKTLAFDMTTNGLLLNETMTRYFQEHTIRVLLSIDGLRESHDLYRIDRQGRGSFGRALRGLALLKKTQPWIGVKMTVMPANVSRICEDVQGLYRLGVNQFLIGHATGIEWHPTSMEAYGQQLERLRQWYGDNACDTLRINLFDEPPQEQFFGCQAGRNSVAVSILGEVSPCSKIMGIDSRNLVGKLGDVWYGLTHLGTRAQLVSCAPLQSACEKEGIADTYQGGCFAVNYTETGDLFRPSRTEHSLSLVKRGVCAGCTAR